MEQVVWILVKPATAAAAATCISLDLTAGTAGQGSQLFGQLLLPTQATAAWVNEESMNRITPCTSCSS